MEYDFNYHIHTFATENNNNNSLLICIFYSQVGLPNLKILINVLHKSVCTEIPETFHFTMTVTLLLPNLHVLNDTNILVQFILLFQGSTGG